MQPIPMLCVVSEEGSTEESDCETARNVYSLVHKKAKQKHAQFLVRSKIALAISTGFWVAVFGLPLYNIPLNNMLLGSKAHQRPPDGTADNATRSSQCAHETYEQCEIEQRMQQAAFACTPTDTGKMRTVNPLADPHLMPWNGSGTWDQENNPQDVWCGYFPEIYLSWWPNVAQFIVFSVFMNTGTTVNLAWQGFIGTLVVSANVQFLTVLFPQGALGHKCLSGDVWVVLSHYRNRGWVESEANTEKQANTIFLNSDWAGLEGRAIFNPWGEMVQASRASGQAKWKQKLKDHYSARMIEDCVGGSVVYNDATYGRYGNFVCILDYLLVVFFFLISKANRNTMIWGLSWHAFYMMAFMDPSTGNALIVQYIKRYGHFWGAWLSSSNFIVVATSLLGCAFCVVATFVPGMNLCNLFHLFSEAESLTNDITTVWGELLEYLSGTEQSAKRFQVERQIDDLRDAAADVRSHLDGAWWETLNLGTRGKRRMRLEPFSACVLEVQRILQSVKLAMLLETFSGSHTKFMQQVHAPADELRQSTADLMWLCLEACQPGDFDDEDAVALRDSIQAVTDNIQAVRDAAGPALSRVQDDLAEESILMFALVFWSNTMINLGEHYIQRQERPTPLWKELRDGFIATWSPEAMFIREHVLFCVRNFVAIGICFFIGLYGWGELLPQYNPQIPNTLSVLLLWEGAHSVDLNRNLQRILGVSLGKIVPMLCTWLFISYPCGSNTRFVIQAVVIWVYMTSAMLVYFTSPTWNYVGCLLGGFGVYGLLLACPTAESEAATRYSEIVQITLAVFIQSFVSAFTTKKTPQAVIVRHLKATSDAVVNAYEAIVDDDLSTLRSEVRSGLQSTELAASVLPECDSTRAFCVLSAEKFKLELAQTAIDNFRNIFNSFSLVIVAAQTWKEQRDLGEPVSAGVLSILKHQFDAPGVNIHEDLLGSARLVQEVLPDVLSEDPQLKSWALRQPEDLKAAMALSSVDHLYEQLASLKFPLDPDKDYQKTMSMRLMIVIRSLQRSAFHLGSIEEGIIKAAS